MGGSALADVDAFATLEDSLAAVVRPAGTGDLAAAITADRQGIRDSLYRAGALLFRGFAVADAAGFEAATRAFTPGSFSYVGGGTPRTRIAGEVYTSTELSRDLALPLHNEASYFSTIPEFVWLFCKVPAAAGGETPLGDMRKVLERLDPALVARVEEKGLRYVNNLHGGDGFGKSWQATYQTENREEVEERARAKGFEAAWLADGTLRVEMRAPGLRTHSVSGDLYWGNQIANWHPSVLPAATRAALVRIYGEVDRYPKSVSFGDGAPITDEEAFAVARALEAEETTFAWQAGDVLLIDNQAIAHGRRPFVGERLIMAALA